MALDKNAIAAIEEANPKWASDADEIISKMKSLKSSLQQKSPSYIEYLATKAGTPTAKTASDILKNIKA